MKTIAVLADFTPETQNALRYAVALSQAHTAKLVLIYVAHMSANTMGPTGSASATGIAYTDPLVYDATTIQMEEERMRDEEKQFNELISGIRYTVQPDQLVEGVFLRGVGLDVSLDYLREHPVGLVVLGTKGSDSSLDRWLGSTTSNVMEHAPCPVLAVPEHRPFTGLSKIVIAADPHHENQWHLEELKALEQLYRAEITVLYVQANKDDVANDDRWTVFSQRLELQAPTFKFARVYSSELVKSIENYSVSQNADLLVVAKQNRSFLDGLFHSSATDRLTQHNILPLLSFPAPAEGDEMPLSIFTM